MLDAAVLGEVKHRLFAKPRRIQIAGVHDQLILFGHALGDNLAIGRHNRAAPKQRVVVLHPSLRHRDHPSRVLIGPGLQRQAVVKHPVFLRLVAAARVGRGRVKAQRHHLHALQTHHPIGLRPATVVANAHPHHAAQDVKHRKAKIPWQKIALLQMLKRNIILVLSMTRQMDLAILANNRPSLIGEDRGIVMLTVRRQLSIAK